MANSTARKIEKSETAYRSIGEAAEELGLPTHVLRYWETKFESFVKPLKRRDGRRMYRVEDIEALKAIQTLVHVQGMTLKGADKLLGEQGVDRVNEGRARLAGPQQSSEDVPASGSSPALKLQETVRHAFRPADRPAAEGSSQRLEAVLKDMIAIGLS